MYDIFRVFIGNVNSYNWNLRQVILKAANRIWMDWMFFVCLINNYAYLMFIAYSTSKGYVDFSILLFSLTCTVNSNIMHTYYHPKTISSNTSLKLWNKRTFNRRNFHFKSFWSMDLVLWYNSFNYINEYDMIVCFPVFYIRVSWRVIGRAMHVFGVLVFFYWGEGGGANYEWQTLILWHDTLDDYDQKQT